MGSGRPNGRVIGEELAAMEHRTTIIELGEGTAQVVCSCGWRSERYGLEKDTGTMDTLQQAARRRRRHEWDAGLS
jgi:hypothetical protein